MLTLILTLRKSSRYTFSSLKQITRMMTQPFVHCLFASNKQCTLLRRVNHNPKCNAPILISEKKIIISNYSSTPPQQHHHYYIIIIHHYRISLFTHTARYLPSDRLGSADTTLHAVQHTAQFIIYSMFFKVALTLLVSLFVAGASAADMTYLVTFDGASKGTTFKWKDLNDVSPHIFLPSPLNTLTKK